MTGTLKLVRLRGGIREALSAPKPTPGDATEVVLETPGLARLHSQLAANAPLEATDRLLRVSSDASTDPLKASEASDDL